MMECVFIRNLLQEYAEGKLPQQEQTIVLEHFRSCPECRQIAIWYKEMQDLIKAEKQPVDDPFMAQRIMEKIESGQKNWWLVYLKPVLIAAMFLLMVFSGIRIGIAYAYKQTVETDYANEIYFLSGESSTSTNEKISER